MFNDLCIEPLSLWHEDVLADATAAVRQVADHIGIALDPGATVQIPEIQKQAAGEGWAWIERYARSRAAADPQSSSS